MIKSSHHGHNHDDDHRASHDRPAWVRRLTRALAPHSHDHVDSTDEALDRSGLGIRAVKISLLGLGITALLQVAVVVVSGSVALLADTIHNFSDALTAGPLWVTSGG